MGYLDYRKHQTVKKPKNRHFVDVLCDYILADKEHKDFLKNPTANHVYYNAYALRHGTAQANQLLLAAKGSNETR